MGLVQKKDDTNDGPPERPEDITDGVVDMAL